ncbi:MAG TPA: 30S ribosomal protein S13 [Firmicutes bacterium]|nr:30S ribosomal protein S13 [Bacillota bacterium]
MARIAGVDLPREKPARSALTYIFGIGESRALQILNATSIDPQKRMGEMTDDEINRLRGTIESSFRVEGELRTEIEMNIRRLQDIGCYRGIRHRRHLPVRGQRTHTNARTRKGPRRQVAGARKKGKK